MKKIAILVEDLYQDLEVWYPYYRLREAGYETVFVGTGTSRHYRGKNGYPLEVQEEINRAKPADFVAVVIPGGWAPDKLRLSREVLDFVREMDRSGKVVAAICHAGWVLASAGIAKGRTVTSYIAIRDDLVNAGAEWVDKEVVRDRNLITSRKPDDLPAFCRTILESLSTSQKP